MEPNISANKKRGWVGRLAIICLFLLVIIPLSMIPVETTVVPEWEIKVVDSTGKPLPHVFEIGRASCRERV